MKKTIQIILLLLLLNLSRSLSISSHGTLSDSEVRHIQRRQLLEFAERSQNVIVDPSLVFENPRLRNAYIALQAWKQAIFSDPFNFTANWIGSNVCNYTGVFCSPALDNRRIPTVAGINLNHADIAGGFTASSVDKLKKVVEEGNAYGALQMYKSFSARYVTGRGKICREEEEKEQGDKIRNKRREESREG